MVANPNLSSPTHTVADVYIRLFDAVLQDSSKVSHGREGYFFIDNGELSVGELLQSIADALFALGRISTRELIPYAADEAGKFLINDVREPFYVREPPSLIYTRGRFGRYTDGCLCT